MEVLGVSGQSGRDPFDRRACVDPNLLGEVKQRLQPLRTVASGLWRVLGKGVEDLDDLIPMKELP